ncbi:unnamed protein product [marine sediment metagenome]|uniref:Uncharacterized protein n=1 Tax=marine sediment metagenome TaxID=412755 RepID=X0Z6Q8_9ZZZZ
MTIRDKIGNSKALKSNPLMAVDPCGFAERYPGIWEFICQHAYNGKPIETSKVIFFVDGNKASLCLSDRHQGQVAFFTAETFGEALEGAENGLQSESLDWRPDKKYPRR